MWGNLFEKGHTILCAFYFAKKVKKLNDKQYIIPHNYKENGKILGMFEKQSAFIAAVLTLSYGYIIFKLPIAFNIRLILFSLILPLSWIALTSFTKETAIDFLAVVFKWKQYKNIYLYKGRGDKFERIL